MSGGSHDYAYRKLENIAESFYQAPEKIEHLELRKKVHDILQIVAKACHIIEWIDSGDYGESEWAEVKKELDKITIKNK